MIPSYLIPSACIALFGLVVLIFVTWRGMKALREMDRRAAENREWRLHNEIEIIVRAKDAHDA